MAACGTPGAALSRLSRKLYKMRGQDAFEPLLRVVGEVAGGDLSNRQRDALEDVRLAFKIR